MKRALFTGAVAAIGALAACGGPQPLDMDRESRSRSFSSTLGELLPQGSPRRWRHRLHGYLAIADAFIFFHLPPAFLHCFFVPASEISDPSALTQWRLAFANAAGEATRANAAIRANFIQLLLGRVCLLAILARSRGLASIELARPADGAWAVADVCEGNPATRKTNSCAAECRPLPPRSARLVARRQEEGEAT